MAGSKAGDYQVIKNPDDDSEDYNSLMSWHHYHFEYHRELATFSDPVSCMNFSQDGKTFCSATRSGDIKVWDSVSWSELTTLNGVKKEEPSCLLVSPGQRWLVSVQPTALIVFRFEAPFLVEHVVKASDFTKQKDATWITACFSPIGVEVDSDRGVTGHDNHLAAMATSHICRIDYAVGWGASSQQTNSSARFRQAECMTYSSDGTYLAIGYSDGLVQIWNAASVTLSQNLMAHSGPVNCLASSPMAEEKKDVRGYGKLRIATGGRDGQIRLWASGGWYLEQMVDDITADGMGILCICFSMGHCGTAWLITATSKLCIWRIHLTKFGKWTLRRHQTLDPVCSAQGLRTAAISIDRDSVVCGSRDGALGLWTKREGRPREDCPQDPRIAHPLHKRGGSFEMPRYIAAARPMRKMAEIAPQTEKLTAVIAVADLSGPKNWVRRVVARPVSPGNVEVGDKIVCKVEATGSSELRRSVSVGNCRPFTAANPSSVTASQLQTCMIVNPNSPFGAVCNGFGPSKKASSSAAARLLGAPSAELRPTTSGSAIGSWSSGSRCRLSLSDAMNSSTVSSLRPCNSRVSM